MRVVSLILMVVVIVLAIVHSLRSPSLKDEERACARKCQGEGYPNHRFTPPSVTSAKTEVVPQACRCER